MPNKLVSGSHCWVHTILYRDLVEHSIGANIPCHIRICPDTDVFNQLVPSKLKQL